MIDAAVRGVGVGARLVDVEAALTRHESFVVTEDGRDMAENDGEDGLAVAHDLVLRTLRIAADPLNHRLLARLAQADAPLAALGRLLGMPRAATWERVNDLVQSGLVGRSIERDLIGLTPAGQEMVEFVSTATSSAATYASGSCR